MQLTTRDGAAVFRKLDLKLVHSTHHVRGYLYIDGVRVLALYYSHGHKAFPGRTSEKFRRSMRLTQDELRAFISCTLSREKYFEILSVRAVAIPHDA